MFYAVKKVDSHPCFDMQELIYSVFFAATQNVNFGKNVFPERFSIPKAWGNLKGVRGKFEELYVLLMSESLAERKRIYSQLVDNNMVEIFCSDGGLVPDIHLDWTKELGKKVKEVILHCFKKLDLSHFKIGDCKLKPTHRYYRDYIKLNKTVCPFCSINNYKNPLSPRREDFDHYLPKSIYPLAAANMANLVPMCNECNQDYKKIIDPLYEGDNRVVAFYPFSTSAGVSLIVSSVVEPKFPFVRSWSVEIVPNNVTEALKVENWNRVFSINFRLESELAQFYEEWVKQALDEKKDMVFTSVDLFQAHMKSRVKIEKDRFARRNEPKSILKAAFYKYMQNSADLPFIESYIRQHNEAV